MSPDAVAAALFDEDAALPARVVADESPPSWHRAGLLSTWVDDAGRADLEDVFGVPLDGRLLGWAAFTGDRECGADVPDTLWGAVALRLLGHHFSLLRFRLAVLLSPEAYFGDPALRTWIAWHVHVVGVPLEADLAVHLDQVVRSPVPPLLRATGPSTPARVREAAVRAAVNGRRRRLGGARRQLLTEIRARRATEPGLEWRPGADVTAAAADEPKRPGSPAARDMVRTGRPRRGAVADAKEPS